MLLRAGLMLDGEASRATTADGRLLFPAMELLACLLASLAWLADLLARLLRPVRPFVTVRRACVRAADGAGQGGETPRTGPFAACLPAGLPVPVMGKGDVRQKRQLISGGGSGMVTV